ncbi:carboxypeptidase regulatory-like domain-containing protein [Candidatus Bathyarchaeota archaeon A05DMB-2]|jgi:hypothetical protein|nr:carboxypeptidase regulatory-like domain-containing protein [Candidatus Bathyarchaeota archaeon A05DMB-2]
MKLSIVFSALLLMALVPIAAAQNYYTVTVEVKNGETPIQNAEVWLGKYCANTDSNGIAVFESVEAGRCLLTVYLDGILSSREEVSVYADGNFVVDFAKQQAPKLEAPSWASGAVILAAIAFIIIVAAVKMREPKPRKWESRVCR